MTDIASNKAWIKSTLARCETGRVPYNFMFSPRALARVQAHYGTTDIADALDLPIRMVGPASIKPLYADPSEFGDEAPDEFGVIWRTSPIDRGSPVPCLREPDLSSYTFPDPAAPYRFEGLAEWCRDNAAHYTVLWVGDLWERATFMRGMEELLLDTVLKQSFVEELLERLADRVLATMTILFEIGEFDCIAVSDDYGAQKGMLMSPDAWRHFVRPHLARIYAFAKQHGRDVFHHTCGHVVPIVGDMIDIGLNILHPIQPEAMDIIALKREFGRDVTFCGGIGTQDLLPRATPQQVRDEIRKTKVAMGAGGGYILEPGITLQADIPTANLVAMIEAARTDD